MDLEIVFLVYCAGADPDFRSFLGNDLGAAEAMVQRNCVVPMQLCHHLVPAMVGPRRGALVFAEALWAELRDQGVDVLGPILGKTDTPALRRLEHLRGQLDSLDESPADAVAADAVVSEAFDHLTEGPTWFVGEQMRTAVQRMGSITRNQAVEFITAASAAPMGDNS